MPRVPIAAAWALVAALVLSAPALAADPPSTPSPSVGFDGAVDGVAVSGSTAFVAGEFSGVGDNAGGLFATDAVSGSRSPALPVVEGSVSVILADGSGGWYIGGSWQRIAGVRAPGGVAHVRADGSPDPGFVAPLISDVEALALAGTPARLVVGGGFDCVGGDGDGTCGGGGEPAGEVVQRRLTALDPASGALDAARFGDTGLNGTVSALAVSGSRLVVGGRFGCARGDGDLACAGAGEPAAEVARHGLAAYDAAGTLDLSWSPDVYRSAATTEGSVVDLAVTPTLVYAAGFFDCAATTMTADADCIDATETPRHNVVATGVPGASDAIQPYAPEPNSFVSAVAVTASRVYLGGYFTCLKGDADQTCGGAGEPAGEVARRGLAATTATGTPEAWDPRLDAPAVESLLVGADGVYVAGSFRCTQADGAPRCDGAGELPRRNGAAFDPVTAATLAWNPAPGQPASALARGGNGPVVLAGDMRIAGASNRVGLAAIDLRTGALLPWNPFAGQDEDKFSGYATALSPDRRTLYVSTSQSVCAGYDGDGDCADPGETSVGQLVAIDVASGAISTTFTPRPDEGPAPLVVAPDGTIYFAGIECLNDPAGTCATPDAQPRPFGTGAVAASGAVLPWAPRLNRAPADLAVLGGAVYAVGRFTCAGGSDTTCGNEPALETTRLRAAAFDPVSAALLPWNPAASVAIGSPASTGLSSVLPDPARGRIIIAGGFSCLQTSIDDADCGDAGEVPRRAVAAVDPVSGAAQPWGPASIAGVPAPTGEQDPARVLALTADGGTVLFGGRLATLDGAVRETWGSLDAATGAGTGWNPGGGTTAFGIATAPGTAIAFGSFQGAGGLVRSGLALFGAFPAVPPAVAPTPPDRTAPVITNLRVGKRFRLGKSLVKAAAVRRAIPVGTTVRFTLSEDAAVRLTVARKAGGRRSGKRCVAPAKARRGARPCVRLVAVKGSATVRGRRGANRVAFAGRLSRRVALKPGRHVLTLVATDAAGNRSLPRSAAFALVKAGR